MERLLNLIDAKALLTQVVEAIPQVIAAIVMLGAFYFLFRIVRQPIRALLRRSGFADTLVKLLVDNLVRYALMVVGLVMAADQLGIDVAAAVAGLGVAGIAIGFAAKDSLSNIIAGVIIFWDKPFVVGDWLTVSGTFGQIADITLRSTRIRTPRNTIVVIPNHTVIDTVIENHSKDGDLRVDVPVGIAYKEDIGKAREVILGCLGGVDGLLDQPAADVVVQELADSGVNLLVRVWIQDAGARPKTVAAVLERVKESLDDAGIQIPFPHLQLLVDDVGQPVFDKAAAMQEATRH